jgi:hypothetical protein
MPAERSQRDKKQRLARQAQWRAMREQYPLQAVKLYLPEESPEAYSRHEKAKKLLAQVRRDRQLLKRKRGLVEWRDVDLAARDSEREACARVSKDLARLRRMFRRHLKRKAAEMRADESEEAVEGETTIYYDESEDEDTAQCRKP